MVSRANKRRDLRTPFFCAVYYSDGAFHASGMTQNLTKHGGCLRGTNVVTVGMQLVVLLVPIAKHALLVKKATVRWVGDAQFGVELSAADCRTVRELGEANVHRQDEPLSLMMH